VPASPGVKGGGVGGGPLHDDVDVAPASHGAE